MYSWGILSGIAKMIIQQGWAECINVLLDIRLVGELVLVLTDLALCELAKYKPYWVARQ
jgi:hypothetical protein